MIHPSGYTGVTPSPLRRVSAGEHEGRVGLSAAARLPLVSRSDEADVTDRQVDAASLGERDYVDSWHPWSGSHESSLPENLRLSRWCLVWHQEGFIIGSGLRCSNERVSSPGEPSFEPFRGLLRERASGGRVLEHARAGVGPNDEAGVGQLAGNRGRADVFLQGLAVLFESPENLKLTFGGWCLVWHVSLPTDPVLQEGHQSADGRPIAGVDGHVRSRQNGPVHVVIPSRCFHRLGRVEVFLSDLFCRLA